MTVDAKLAQKRAKAAERNRRYRRRKKLRQDPNAIVLDTEDALFNRDSVETCIERSLLKKGADADSTTLLREISRMIDLLAESTCQRDGVTGADAEALTIQIDLTGEETNSDEDNRGTEVRGAASEVAGDPDGGQSFPGARCRPT
jgi:hypothetical protein